jgi:predicted nucleic acid-binding protein
MRAVADTGPLHYLVLAGHIQILTDLFSEVAIPHAVQGELAHPGAPVAVRDWIAAPPTWLSVNSAAPDVLAQVDAVLDPGERAALALAMERQPDLVLMDDHAGVAAAHARGFVVTGTLGLLVRAARRDLLDLPAAMDALGRTNFRWTPSLRARVLAEHTKERGQ